MKYLFSLMILMTLAFPAAAQPLMGQQVDLILPPQLVSADAPFYRGAKVKIGTHVTPVQEAPLPQGQLAAYVPETGEVIVSNSTTASETAKGQALLDVVTAMQLGDIATAAGQ